MSAPPNASGPLPWPQWAYVPGEAGLDADYETLAMAKALAPSAFRGHVPARHPALRYGLALNDRGYFWEAQEVLEAVWAAAPQGGRERILLRACIHIANANLRLRMQRSHSAARLFGDALADAARAELAQGGGRRRLCRELSHCCADGLAPGQARSSPALQGRLDRTRHHRAVLDTGMKQSACIGC
ncbi:hypothetical protein ACVIWV_008287 [Bradyrhizobium diazoefficiens]